MNAVLGTCPVCGDEMVVTRLQCRGCSSELSGFFGLERIYRLGPEQRRFLELFIKNRGNVMKVAEEVGISYPTARNRLSEVISALGYEVVEEPEPDSAAISEEERRAILEQLAQGLISSEEAVNKLRGE
jgi:hypothetical protein